MGIVDIVGSNKRLVIDETLNEEDQRSMTINLKEPSCYCNCRNGQVDCDGGEPGASASLLNICDAVSVALMDCTVFFRIMRTFTKTGADCPPLTAHFPSMIVNGTPVTPFATASATWWFTLAKHSSDFPKSSASDTNI